VAESTEIVDKVGRREEQERLVALLRQLSDAHREVVLQRNYAGHDWKSVGDKMGKTPEACQELYRRAKRELERLWGGEEE
jgi:DNA-directed RNA polymerase specialized sigma24 family protein